MKEYKALVIDNIPDGLNPYLVSDFPPPQVGGSAANTTVIFQYRGKKYYGSNNTTAYGGPGTATNSYFCVTLANLGLDMSKHVIFGCRALSSHPQYFAMWGFANAAVSSIFGGTVVANSAAFNLQSYVEYYLEMEIVKATLSINHYVDGVLKYTVALTQAQFDAMATSYPVIYFGGGFGQAPFWYMRDIYIAHCNGSDDVTPLGPIVHEPAQIATLTPGSNWSRAAGQGDLDFLAAPADKASGLFLPRFENAAGSGSFTQRLAMPANPIGAIKGVQFQVSGQDRAAVLRNMSGSITQGGQTVTFPNKQFDGSMRMGRQLGTVQMAAPDGGVWTPAKLAATDFAVSLV